MKYDVIIVASGKGVRANLGYNKVFYKLKNGKSVLDYSIELFYEDQDCLRIIVVTNEEDLINIKDNNKLITVIGGKERKDSVYNGLKEVKSEYVMIHDGARPFVKKENIDDIKKALIDNDAVCLGSKATDTIKIIDNDVIVETIDRNKVLLAQTPQAFKTSLIKDCYEKCKDALFTDDSSLVESLGYKVKVVLNEHDNHKLTREEDFYNL
jgi:2-C-methyl-D-erythritol 4-phosphate cytidylyltransferase